MTVQTARFALHEVHTSAAGIGAIVLPRPEADVWLPAGPEGAPASGVSLRAADWAAVVAWLLGQGWEPVEAEWDESDSDGMFRMLGTDLDGREVIAASRVGSVVTLEDVREAEADLFRHARIVTI